MILILELINSTGIKYNIVVETTFGFVIGCWVSDMIRIICKP